MLKACPISSSHTFPHTCCEPQPDPTTEYPEPPRQCPPWAKGQKGQGTPHMTVSTAANTTEPIEERKGRKDTSPKQKLDAELLLQMAIQFGGCRCPMGPALLEDLGRGVPSKPQERCLSAPWLAAPPTRTKGGGLKVEKGEGGQKRGVGGGYWEFWNQCGEVNKDRAVLHSCVLASPCYREPCSLIFPPPPKSGNAAGTSAPRYPTLALRTDKRNLIALSSLDWNTLKNQTLSVVRKGLSILLQFLGLIRVSKCTSRYGSEFKKVVNHWATSLPQSRPSISSPNTLKEIANRPRGYIIINGDPNGSQITS